MTLGRTPSGERLPKEKTPGCLPGCFHLSGEAPMFFFPVVALLSDKIPLIFTDLQVF